MLSKHNSSKLQAIFSIGIYARPHLKLIFRKCRKWAQKHSAGRMRHCGKRKEKRTLLRGKATERPPFSTVFSGQSVLLNAQESGIPLQHLGERSEPLQRAMVLSEVWNTRILIFGQWELCVFNLCRCREDPMFITRAGKCFPRRPGDQCSGFVRHLKVFITNQPQTNEHD